VVVSVRDRGPGIPVAERRNVWERFYCVVETQAVGWVGGGLRLGPHNRKTLIERHNGRIGLRRGRGGGTMFWFELERHSPG
jgi:K+-sensing histidine kinase KdpD